MPAYQEHDPPPAFARYIDCAWSLSSDHAIAGHRVPPDGCLDIVYSREEGVRVVGTMTTEQRFNYSPGTMMVGVRFNPGMAGLFLGTAAAELTNRIVSLADVWGRP